MPPLDPHHCLPAVRQHLYSLNLHVLDEWTEQCVQFLLESTHPPPATIQALCPLVVTQLLHTDLCQVGLPTIPPELAAFGTQNAFLAPGDAAVVLQIMAIEEIGHSTLSVAHALEAVVAYSEAEAARSGANNGQIGLQQQQHRPAGGRRQVPPTIPRKMLKLTLTDGHITLVGMEYKSMPFLSLLTPLGAKVVRVRNAPCSRTVIQLTPQNTELIGGDVEELACDVREYITRLYNKLGIQPPNSQHVARVDRVDPHAMQFLIEPPGPEDLEDLDPPPPPPLLFLNDEQQQQDQEQQPPPPPPGPDPPAPLAPFLAPPPPPPPQPLILPPRQPTQPARHMPPPPPPPHYPTPPAFNPGPAAAYRTRSPPRPAAAAAAAPPRNHVSDDDDNLFDTTFDELPDDLLAQADLLASQRRVSIRDQHTAGEHAYMAGGDVEDDVFMDADEDEHDDDGIDYSAVPDVNGRSDVEDQVHGKRAGPRLDADFIPLDNEDLLNWPTPGASAHVNQERHGDAHLDDLGDAWFDDFYVPPDAMDDRMLASTTWTPPPPAFAGGAAADGDEDRSRTPGLSQKFSDGLQGIHGNGDGTASAGGQVQQVPSPTSLAGSSSGAVMDPVAPPPLKRCTLEEVAACTTESAVIVTNAQLSSAGISLQYKPRTRKRAIRVIVPLSPRLARATQTASQPSSSFKSISSSAPPLIKAVIDEPALRALGVDIDLFKRTKDLALISGDMSRGITRVLGRGEVVLRRVLGEEDVWEVDVGE
ncbi:hypothetical protein BCR44DRAFT_1433043 [Catenaria anguillulae PL171]|uniref:RecQ-mediated genome instability protein 1 n=1 Tax=Catenaria anguillulae PL171 TaxID=765915 RepID=A0A1Y2HNR9_9FUNG|nr:hypothetical protein BCR44DRAFT_1433043 [Catenaria anguillulae PL171]